MLQDLNSLFLPEPFFLVLRYGTTSKRGPPVSVVAFRYGEG